MKMGCICSTDSVVAKIQQKKNGPGLVTAVIFGEVKHSERWMLTNHLTNLDKENLQKKKKNTFDTHLDVEALRYLSEAEMAGYSPANKDQFEEGGFGNGRLRGRGKKQIKVYSDGGVDGEYDADGNLDLGEEEESGSDSGDGEVGADRSKLVLPVETPTKPIGLGEQFAVAVAQRRKEQEVREQMAAVASAEKEKAEKTSKFFAKLDEMDSRKAPPKVSYRDQGQITSRGYYSARGPSRSYHVYADDDEALNDGRGISISEDELVTVESRVGNYSPYVQAHREKTAADSRNASRQTSPTHTPRLYTGSVSSSSLEKHVAFSNASTPLKNRSSSHRQVQSDLQRRRGVKRPASSGRVLR